MANDLNLTEPPDSTPLASVYSAIRDLIADLDDQLGDGLPAGMVVRTTAQSIPSGAFTAVTFTTEIDDVTNAWDASASPTRVTATRPGLYEFHGGGGFSTATTGRVACHLTRNGTALGGGQLIPSANDASVNAHAMIRLTAGQWVDLRLFQETGSAKDTSTGTFAQPYLMWKWLRP